MEEMQTAAQTALAKQREDADAKLKRALNDKAIEMEGAILRVKTEQDEAVAKALNDAAIEHKRLLDEAEQRNKATMEREQHRLSLLAEQETERELAAASEQHYEETKALQAKLDASEQLRSEVKDAFAARLEQVKAHAEDVMNKRLSEVERRAKEQQTTEREKAQLEFDRHRSEWNRAHKMQLGKVEADAVAKSNAAIQSVQEEAREAMKLALDKLTTTQEERERALELENRSLISERDSALDNIALLESEIKSQQSAVEQIRQELDSCKKLTTLRILRLATSSMAKQDAYDKALQARQDDFNAKLKKMHGEATSKLQPLEGKVANMETSIKSYQTQRKMMYDTLVTHNRDALLRQKATSRDVSSQLEVISSERKALQGKRTHAEDQRRETENKTREIEAQIQQHAQTSSIQGGRVNIAHARKKRKLDEEYEGLLDKLESNREDILRIDTELKDVMERKEAADERLKSIERKLVEMLVEQNKKMLKILNMSKHDACIS